MTALEERRTGDDRRQPSRLRQWWARWALLIVLGFGYLVAQGINAGAVYMQGQRVNRLVQASRLEAVGDCVENRERARADELEALGIAVLSTPRDDPGRDEMVRRLQQVPAPSDRVNARDVAVCQRQLHLEPTP